MVYQIHSVDDIKNIVKQEPIIQLYKSIKKNDEYQFAPKEVLPDYDRTTKRLVEEIKKGKDFLILTDYDADGVMSGYIHYMWLQHLIQKYNSTSQVRFKPTNRYEWYGISHEFFESDVLKKYDNILTTDIGISVPFPAHVIKEKNIFIFDHHLPVDSEILLCQEVREKYPTIDSKETYEEALWYLMYLWVSYDNFYINNPVTNRYEYFFHDNRTPQKKYDTEKYNELEISAGWVTFLFWWNFLQEEWYSSRDIMLLSIPAAVSTITDVMPLHYANNMSVYLLARKLITLSRYERKKVTKHIKNDILRELFEHMLTFFYSFDKQKPTFFTIKDLGFGIGPYINSYGRMFVSHELFLQLLGKGEFDESLNMKRKEYQATLQWWFIDQLSTDWCVNVCSISHDIQSELNNNKMYRISRNYFTTTHPELFDDIISPWEVGDISLADMKEKLLNVESIIGLLAGKLKDYNNKTTIVGVKDWDIISGSGRSNLPLFDLGIASLDSVVKIGWHNSAFGIAINNKDNAFIKEFNEKFGSYEVDPSYYAVFYPKEDAEFAKAISVFGSEYNEFIKESSLVNLSLLFPNWIKDIEENDDFKVMYMSDDKHLKITTKYYTLLMWNYKDVLWEFESKDEMIEKILKSTLVVQNIEQEEKKWWWRTSLSLGGIVENYEGK